LSPLIFWIAAIPLSRVFIRYKRGYQVYGTERKVNHLLYMDDLKPIGRH